MHTCAPPKKELEERFVEYATVNGKIGDLPPETSLSLM